MNVDPTFPTFPSSTRSFSVVLRWWMLVPILVPMLVLGWPCYGQQTVSGHNGIAASAAALPAVSAEAASGQPLLVAGGPESSRAALDEAALPDAPQPQPQPQADQPQDPQDSQDSQDSQNPEQKKPLVAASPKLVPTTTQKPVVGRYVKYIPAGSAAPQIHGREKFILGARDLYSPGNFAAMFVSAGWEQLTNGSPNYGTDKGAFGERLGAAGIRETTEGIFTDGVFSVMLHEDPRYFVLGPKYGLVHRALYVITRPLITRNSSNGHRTINGGLLLGYAASTALTNAYYPQINRNFRDNISSYGGSIGGAALGFAVDEFYDQLLQAVHWKKKP